VREREKIRSKKLLTRPASLEMNLGVRGLSHRELEGFLYCLVRLGEVWGCCPLMEIVGPKKPLFSVGVGGNRSNSA
jgi:hypothetical protein